MLSITRKIQIGMYAFGLLMGAVFPFYARLFTTYNEGMQVYFDLGCLAAGAAIGAISFQLVKKFVLNEIIRVADALEKVNQGDLTIDIQLESSDALGQLVSSFNQLSQHFKSILKELAQSVEHTKDFSIRINHHSEELSKLTQRVESDSLYVQNKTQECSASMNENLNLSSEVDYLLAGASSHTQEITEGVVSVCQRSAEEVKVSDEAPLEVEKAILEINTLALSVDKINSIVEIIKSISEKTNLLALNATIEAASAGDAGKGFAVVAQEVKELASQTNKAVGTIQAQVSSIKSEAENSVHRIERMARLNRELHSTSQLILQDLEIHEKSLVEVVESVTGSSVKTKNIFDRSSNVNSELSVLGSRMDSLSSQLKTANSNLMDMENDIQSLESMMDDVLVKVNFFKYE